MFTPVSHWSTSIIDDRRFKTEPLIIAAKAMIVIDDENHRCINAELAHMSYFFMILQSQTVVMSTVKVFHLGNFS